jgi:hypothetical protein
MLRLVNAGVADLATLTLVTKAGATRRELVTAGLAAFTVLLGCTRSGRLSLRRRSRSWRDRRVRAQDRADGCATRANSKDADTCKFAPDTRAYVSASTSRVHD